MVGALGLILVCFDWSDASYSQFAFILSRWVYGAFLVASLLVLWLPSSHKPRVAAGQSPVWWWADVILCTYTIVPILQMVVPLPRPPESPIDQLLGVPIGGWPSGHQVSMFGLAWVLMVARPRWGWAAFGLAALMGWARIESHAHYPFQVLSGAALGMALGWWTSHRPQGLLLPRVLGWLGAGNSKRNSPPGNVS